MLDHPLHRLTGLTNAEIRQLQNLNLTTLGDLLHHYPRKYCSYHRTRIRQLQLGDRVILAGKIISHRIIDSRKKGLTLQTWLIRDKTGHINCTRFCNHPRYQSPQWREQQQNTYPCGAIVLVRGTVKPDRYSPRGMGIHNPHIEVVDLATAKTARSLILPVYPLTQGTTLETVQNATQIALSFLSDQHSHLNDPLPSSLRRRFNLLDWRSAITTIHYPPSLDTLTTARKRLVFDEGFYLALTLLQRRRTRKQQPSIPLPQTGILLDHFAQQLAFSLTSAQQRVIGEILADMSQPRPMNRLLQGDVGSGKTCVACFAALAAIQGGCQVALMTPTEILAQQHYHQLAQWLTPLGVSVSLLTGSTGTPSRRRIYRDTESGDLSLLIGTHALIQQQVQFQQLGLVICDESHRFGVLARHQLQQKGNFPHVLTMTATPIPRTLALTVYGDLAMSRLDKLPPGRKAIVTRFLSPETRFTSNVSELEDGSFQEMEREAKYRRLAYQHIRQEVTEGRQAYIILPLVEASEHLNLKAAIAECDRLSTDIFPEFSVGLLHGRMKPDEKRAAMTQFQSGETPILVSTTVVEVGVDNPSATIILIEHAERFGLAQLHQLRGRVGRGPWQSYCYLVSDSSSESSRARLEMMERSQDGFELAEFDLQLRGPGKVLGTQQSGFPQLALADIVEDGAILKAAYRAARLLLKKDPTLTRFPRLKAKTR